MAYCTQNDMENLELTLDELIQLTNDVPNATSVDSVKVDAAILKADKQYIDPYCRGRYSVPFSPVPDEIMFISATIAAYYLCRRRQRAIKGKENSILDKYTKAVATLKRISEGSYSLDGVAEKSDASGIGSTTEERAHTFTRTEKDSDGNITKTGSMETW